MQLEVEECVAYAASLRMEVGEENEQGLLTPGVSLKFQQAIEKRHSGKESTNGGLRAIHGHMHVRNMQYHKFFSVPMRTLP